MTITDPDSDSIPSSFVLDADQVPHDLRDTEDRSPVVCKFPGCTNGVTRSGKGGRPPAYCDEHKGKRPTAKSAVSGKTWTRAVEVENILNKYVAGLSTGIRLVNPKDGQIIADGGPAVIHELVELAKTDTKIRQPLEWLTAPGKYGPLAIASASVILPIMANHGLLPQFEFPNLPRGGE